MAGCESSGTVAGRQLETGSGEGTGMRDLVDGFKAFMLRGNVIDLAVAVVIGIAFTQIINSMVENIVTPITGAIGGQPDFSNLTFTLNNSVFRYGAFINSLILLQVIALVYFLIVKPMNMLATRATPEAENAELALCPECLVAISPEATGCPNCTTWLRGPNVSIV
jgi:large conductance mechanosensitive channel